ncbi:hypothetical protein M406DRAFT_285931 [Cryphonectria parasitica EP155]|uniref:LCCL domain-containing protein n=1 Tax=Cryphonectria parasitica (strain ATCC 38755 / EP155) TaxID=660469 RepID=A0A9P4YDJ9_CRYP1|nr:uncharacterized protein M406DRAFT_285931 [Cryphonectria parasitica EP155]KAF3771056.1 hypothetical protein M406DRAFT_285931 [Cryphonectria parasitica EP155]
MSSVDGQAGISSSRNQSLGNPDHPNESIVEAHPDAPIEGPPRLHELQEGNPTNPLPRFLEEENLSKHWRWIPYPLRKLGRSALRWAQGPASPVAFRITPLFPTIQHFPIFLLDKYLPRRKHRILLFIGYILLWILTFSLVKRHESSLTELKPWGKPQEIGCGNYFWGRGNQCDLNGNRCRPFQGTGFAFRCPANCASYQLSEPRAVGDRQINYRPLVVGGPVNHTDSYGAYRADSFICGSAIHAGVISNAEGGCGVVRLVGERSSFSATWRNGIESIGFDSYFPKSYLFEESVQCKARDMRWSLLVVSVVFTTVLSLFTTSPSLFFFTVFTGVFWHVGLVSDAPNHSSFRELFTIILGRYLPVMFVAWVMYDKMAIRRTLKGLTAQVDKTVLWLGTCWVGALDNYTLSPNIPISRLNAHDIRQQPGGVLALIIIVFVLFFIVLKQIWFFRQEGRLISYGRLYLGLLGGILFCLFLSIWDLHLRIHHYFLALLLLTGTSMQTRPALLYQGLLIGLFINGIARWGWDPILQTSNALRRDGQLGSVLPKLADAPEILVGSAVSNITFRFEAPPKRNIRLDGISLLVNDVERFKGYFEDDKDFEEDRSFTWNRKAELGLKEYFRFAYLYGTTTLDYTKAGVWDADFEWEHMKPGASSLESREVSEGNMMMVD